MQVQEQTQAPAAPNAPPQNGATGGQHVSGDVWNTVFKDRPEDRLATFLGWFSIGLGLTETFLPGALDKLIGAPRHRGLTRAMGLREIAVGIGILATPKPAGWLKARVAGDAVDLGLLAKSFKSGEASALRLTGATAMVAGVTALDVMCATKLNGGSEAMRLQTSIAINQSPAECYRYWRESNHRPRFLHNAEITSTTADQEIEWHSRPGARHENSGSVRFEPRLTGTGTVVRVSMQCPAAIGGSLAEAYSEDKLREELRRVKSFMETGEAPTTKGQPSGREGVKAS